MVSLQLTGTLNALLSICGGLIMDAVGYITLAVFGIVLIAVLIYGIYDEKKNGKRK